jgi:hypothetical protein
MVLLCSSLEALPYLTTAWSATRGNPRAAQALERKRMGSALILRWTIGISVAVAVYQTVTFYLGLQTSAEFDKVWGYAFAGMLAFWVDEDSKRRPEFDRPSFDIGLFLYLAWLVYLPYYLLKTRGRNGWLWILGFLVLGFLGALLQLAVYAAS